MRSLLSSLFILLFPLIGHSQSTNDPGFGSKINYRVYGAVMAGDEATSWGVGLNAWYFISDQWGLGPSLSYTDYSLFFNEKLFNTGAEAIYFLPMTDGLKLYGSLDLGYNHPILNRDEFNQAMVSGGMYVNPQLGIFLKSPRNIAFTLGIGYMRQPWSFTSLDFGTFNSSVKTVYNRYKLSIGIVF